MADRDDVALREALDMKKRLEAALAVVEDQISNLRRAAQLKKKLLDIDLPERITKSRKRQRNVRPHDVAMMALDIISEAGRPMNRSELADAIESRGVTLPGRDKVKNLGTVLWRYIDIFDHYEGRGYWPKGRQLPEA